VLAKQGASEQAGDPSVAVLERMDDEKVEDEQPSIADEANLANDLLLAAISMFCGLDW
jgi:hypothetical protein